MSIEEYLKRGLNINKRIESQKALLLSLEEMAVSPSASISNTPGSGSPNPHKLENSVIKIQELTRQIEEENRYLMDVKKQIHELINLVNKDECRIVLQQRYECCKSLDEVAAFTGFAKRSVHRLKKEGIGILNGLENENKLSDLVFI